LRVVGGVGVSGQAPGPAPAGYHPVGESDGSTLLVRHGRDGMSMALQWDADVPGRPVHDR
jgi:hypothetical protein